MTREEAKLTLQENFGYLTNEHPRITEALRVALEVLNEDLLPSNIDEAAKDFVWEVMENDENGISELSKKLRPSSKITDFYDALAEFFKAGAKWTIEQLKEK